MSEEKPLIELLAAACQKHRLTHHKTGTVRVDEKMSCACQKDLKLLKELLPKVEATCCNELNSMEVVGHLCDFYNDVLMGGFCPHAPGLFHCGDLGNGQAFKRIVRLMSYLVSSRIINAKSSALSTKISVTIARLLRIEGRLKPITCDLVNCCFDLSVIRQARLLDSNATVLIAPFGKTYGSGSDQCLRISTVGALYTVQTAVLTILKELASQHPQRLDIDPRGSVDALFDWGDSVPAIVASARQILLTPLDPGKSKLAILSLRAKVSALELFNQIVQEWQEVGVPGDIPEVILTVARFMRWYFSSCTKLTNCRERLAELLRDILLNTVLFTPQADQGFRHHRGCMRSLILPYLLGCIGDLSVVLKQGLDSEKELCIMILESVEIIISDKPSFSEMAFHYCTTRRVFPNLFNLLHISNAHTRVVTIKIIHIFIESNGHLDTFISTACHLAVLSLEERHEVVSANESTDKATPKKACSTQKRKGVTLSPGSRSPLQLLFEPSPKRRRVDAEILSPASQDMTIQDKWTSANVSLADACKVFLTAILESSKRILGKIQSDTCEIKSLADDGRSLIVDLSGCVSALCFLLPILRFHEGSDYQPSVLRALTLLFDTLSKCSIVLEASCREGDGSLAELVEFIVDAGVVTHMAYLRSSTKRPIVVHACVNRFWEASSRCAWTAMTKFSSADSQNSEESLPWRFLCHQCTFLMRFLNLPVTRTRRCLCMLKHRVGDASAGTRIRGRMYTEVSRLPFVVKLILYSFSHPFVATVSQDLSSERRAIDSLCMPVWRKVAEIMDRSDWPSKASPSLFAVAFVALLPAIVFTMTRAVFWAPDGNDAWEKRKLLGLDSFYRAVCASFPHERLLALVLPVNVPPRLRLGALIGLEHYRSLLRSNEWKDDESTGVRPAFELEYFGIGEFVQTVCAMNHEPHHTLSSIDRNIRLSLLSMDHNRNSIPFDRLKEWLILKNVVMQSSLLELRSLPKEPIGCADQVENIQTSTISSVVAHLLSTPFADSDYRVRLALSRELGTFILGQKGHVLLSAFGVANHDESNDEIAKVAVTISSLFQAIDQLLFRHSCIPQSQLSSAFTESSAEAARVDFETAIEHQHTALRAVASLCEFAIHNDTCEQMMFEQGYLRLVRSWIPYEQYVDESEPDLPVASLSDLSHLEMRRLGSISHFSIPASMTHRRTFISSLISEILLPAASALADPAGPTTLGHCLMERQNRLLYSFLQGSIPSRQDDCSNLVETRERKFLHGIASSFAIANFVNEALHFAIPSMVIDKDYDAIRLATGFKLFVLGIHSNTLNGPEDILVGVSIRTFTSRALSASKGRHGLDQQTKLLCLQPNLLQRILPRLLIDNTDRSQLVFFLHIVLQKDVSFQELIASSDKAILREIIWELGGSSNVNQHSVQALKVAAFARDSVARDNYESVYVEPDSHKIHAHEIASRWVSSHFMFLLVNIVQLKWHEKTMDDQVRALRSLDLMLNFLLPSEAPRFLTQLVATINTAMSLDVMPTATDCSGAKAWLLRYLATRCLSTYVDIMVSGHLQTLGENLSTVVVTLFPVLVQPENQNVENQYEATIRADAVDLAVRILQVLTSGNVGKVLSQFFKEIPFLPTTTLLDKIKDNLKSNGVDLGRLPVLSLTQTTDRILSGKDASATDTATKCSSPRVNEGLLTAMQARLRVMRSLLSQESASVRMVTLQHLTDLLRANRYLFYRLMEKEDPSSASLVLTVLYSNDGSYETRGSVTALIETLLRRATVENNKKVRLLLGTCLGEVTAIDPHRLGVISTTDQGSEPNWSSSISSVDGRSWQLSHPPWRSSANDHAFFLLTKLLVNALKAASNSAEQHKVAHAIQQLLVIVESLNQGTNHAGIHLQAVECNAQSPAKKGPMSDWLSQKLEHEGVLNILEPYWASSFSENLTSRTAKEPPFLRTANNYFQWISRWCRYMILRSAENNKSSDWCRLLFACRTMVRASAGTAASEFILPILVLERLCFGPPDDEEIIRGELLDAFQLSSLPIEIASSFVRMNLNERQKAADAAFRLIDTLKLWSERETEGLFRGIPKKDALGSSLPLPFDGGCWNASLALERINDLVNSLPLEAMAITAAGLGMHARALQCLEVNARTGLVATAFLSATTSNDSGEESSIQLTVQQGFGPHLLKGIDLALLREVLGNLDDYPTMKAVPNNMISKVYDREGIRERESRGDWAGALNDYERAIQSQSDPGIRSSLERASLRCLLEMGQYESVLNQVNGILYRMRGAEKENDGAKHVMTLAIGAAWRLGRWSVLESLVQDCNCSIESVDTSSNFQSAIGKAMLGLFRRSKTDVDKALCLARESLMTELASVGRDGYDRAYPSIVRLQCVREIEDANFIFGEGASTSLTGSSTMWEQAMSSDIGGCAWDFRLDSTSTIDSSIITDVRLAIARLAGDARLEREVFITMGKKARKNGQLDFASTCFARSQAVVSAVTDVNSETAMAWIGEVQMQLAKLEYQAGHTTLALLILGVDDVKGWSKLSETERRSLTSAKLRLISGKSPGEAEIVSNDMAKRVLKSTMWMADGGLKAVPELMERFRVSNQLRPKWGKSHFEFAKYLDSLLEARIFGVAQHEGWSAEDISVRQYALSQDMSCQNYLHMAMEQYLEALKVSEKHVYQALPRVLSLWFEYTSVERRGSRKGKGKDSCGDTPVKQSSDPTAFLRNKQDEVNQLFQEAAARIPSSMFYTASPQLISRLCHPNSQTGLAVQTLLTRVLSKFPGQAMWALAWVRNSHDKTRSSLGNEIFQSAQKSINGWASNEKRVDSRIKAIFEKNRKILLASKSFISYLIDVSKYLPKDERARSFKLSRWRGEVELCDFIPPVQTALATPLDTTKGEDHFPRFRAVHSGVQIMSSKAKPKRVKFYVVPAASGSLVSPGVATDRAPEDVGELHFLVKNEAKGDLRKDARVQDLNNVINRLMATAEKGKRQRRLRLRTFAVTCLSEDCGIVEWVPNTESFRSLASKSYNPQVPTYSAKRRGRRIANFGDPSLKKNFEDCQNVFFRLGDLTRAARLFEEHFLNSFPPLFYWWFIQNFMDAHAWYEARTNFTTSASVWSAVGHIIGLGDRHSENLLIDTSTGGCVHVDFDCIFDKGLLLPKPEIIPFRLTPNMIDAFGPVGANGIFADSLKTAMKVLRDNRDTLLSVLEPFVKDPIIDWKKNKGSQRQGSNETGVRDTTQAKLSLKVIDERLRGIYNLRNPNLKKVTRTDHVALDHDDEMARIIPLSVEGQVHKMISEATSHENLVQLYIGWMPWI